MYNKNTAYRPDIDGLRAIAVILVILFHYDLGVSGGFVGVDVFFVISGFLITDVIRNSINENRFSFSDFYIRRLLRLHPALVATISISLITGYLIMDPASFSNLATSAQYSLFSASNFYFWLNQGYFDAAAQNQPLLHTWSLAAEWQFYIIWPLIVWMTSRVSDRFFIWTLIAITIISLIASQLMLHRHASAAYFMMPFRMFELSIGAILVFLARHRTQNLIECGITIAGITLIIGSALFFDSGSSFPGLRALIPCLGAAACIYGAQSSAGLVLRSWPMVKLGIISYSVYLVHWPIVVFYKYYTFEKLALIEKTSLFFFSIIFGAALYVSIERLFIKRKTRIKLAGVSALTASIALLSYGNYLVIESKGSSSRINKELLTPGLLKVASNPVEFHVNNYGGHGYDLDNTLGDVSGKKIAVMAGDSFGLQYASGMDKVLHDRGEYISGVFRHGCILSTEYTRLMDNSPRQVCRDAYKTALSELEGNNLPFILAHSWEDYNNIIANSEGINSQKNGASYAEIIMDILTKARSEIGNRKLFIIGSQPYMRAPMGTALCMLRPTYFAQPCAKWLKYPIELSTPYETNKLLKKFAENHSNTYYIDATPTLCKQGICTTILDGNLMYSDASHLSIFGSILTSKQILDSITNSM